jgi:hypothetical protein
MATILVQYLMNYINSYQITLKVYITSETVEKVLTVHFCYFRI